MNPSCFHSVTVVHCNQREEEDRDKAAKGEGLCAIPMKLVRGLSRQVRCRSGKMHILAEHWSSNILSDSHFVGPWRTRLSHNLFYRYSSYADAERVATLVAADSEWRPSLRKAVDGGIACVWVDCVRFRGAARQRLRPAAKKACGSRCVVHQRSMTGSPMTYCTCKCMVDRQNASPF